MINYYRRRTINESIENRLHRFRIFQNLRVNREFYLIVFFLSLFLIIIIRLFFLQVIEHSTYDNLLNQQNVSESTLQAQRGDIYANDKSANPVKLTENITTYNVFVDPKFIRDKKRFIDLVTPVIYEHLCEIYGMQKMTKLDCIKNIESFAGTALIPKAPEFFYYGHIPTVFGTGAYAVSGFNDVVSSGYNTFDRTGYNNQVQQVISGFNSGIAYGLIKTQMDQMIYIGIKKQNYLGFFYNTNFLEELKKLNLNYVSIENINYVYILPEQIHNITKDTIALKTLLDRYGYLKNFSNIDNVFTTQENRYVKLISDANPIIAQQIKELKLQYYQERSSDKIPILFGLGLEPSTRRYYEYGSFLSNVLGFVDKNNTAFYGIEQYFDSVLAGKNGKIIGRASSWIGNVGANEFQLEEPQDGNDVYLTIDIGIQKEIETIIKGYLENLKADSISVLVYDPFSGQVLASANYPSFNPNDYNTAYDKQPLGIDQKQVLDDITYIDIPVYIMTGGEYRLATTAERGDITLPKYITKNVYGPQVFIDRNTAMAYEPGSIFKAFTVAIGLDTDEIRFYDPYNDPGKVQVGQFTISNAVSTCMGDQNFLHAFVWSCNVGMVRIAQKLGKEIFYNYLDELPFGKMTGIEIANEDPGFVESITTVSDARFFNNAFGQGLLVTPIQLAAGYGAILNGGYYVKPTIIKGIFDKKTNTYYPNTKKITQQIFRPETADALKAGLFDVMESSNPDLKYAKVEGYKLGGKTGTSQISYKGKYMQGNGWTEASFVGVITKDNPQYIIVIHVRRPRQNIWGGTTAGKIFGDVAKFLLNYSLIEK